MLIKTWSIVVIVTYKKVYVGYALLVFLILKCLFYFSILSWLKPFWLFKFPKAPFIEIIFQLNVVFFIKLNLLKYLL